MKLFEMFATLVLDTKDFQRGMEEGQKRVSNFSSSYTKGFEDVAKVVLKTGAVISTGVGVLASVGVAYNTQMETYTTNFEVMLGSTEKAVKKVEELKKFSQSTPFELGDLANATQTLLAFNVSADDSTGILQMLGDISLGNSQKLETLTRAYGKMSSSQKVSLESINMMIDSGYNPLLTIQEKTGASMEEVYDRITKGTLSFEELEDAMKDATSEGGQFYKGMETASKTTQGMISTAKDLVNSKLGEFFQGVSDKIKELLPKAIEFLENMDVQEITGKMEKLYETFVKLSPIIMAVVGGATGLYLGFKALAIVNVLMATFTKLQGSLSGLTLAQLKLNLTMGANPILLVVTVIGVLIGAIGALWVSNEDFRNFFINAWQGMVDFFTNIYNSYFKPIIDNIVALWDNLWTNSLKPLWDNFKTMVSGFVADAQKLWERLEPIFNFIGDIIKNVVIFYFKSLVQYWEWVVSVISGTISVIFNIFTKIAETIANALNGVISFIQNVWSGIKNFITNPVQSALNYLNGMVDKFREWAQKGIDKIKSTFDKIKNIGKDIVRGLWEGINSMGTWITEKVSGFFGGIINKVKGLFGIKSPSRVFKYFGKMVDDGFIDGVLGGAKEINKVMEHTFNAFEPKGASMFDGMANSSFSNVTRAVKNAVNNIVINVEGATNPYETAQEVNRILGGYV